jgi:hypothetical protein
VELLVGDVRGMLASHRRRYDSHTGLARRRCRRWSRRAQRGLRSHGRGIRALPVAVEPRRVPVDHALRAGAAARRAEDARDRDRGFGGRGGCRPRVASAHDPKLADGDSAREERRGHHRRRRSRAPFL